MMFLFDCLFFAQCDIPLLSCAFLGIWNHLLPRFFLHLPDQLFQAKQVLNHVIVNG